MDPLTGGRRLLDDPAPAGGGSEPEGGEGRVDAGGVVDDAAGDGVDAGPDPTWRDGGERPAEPHLGRSTADPMTYQLFATPGEATRAGFEPVRGVYQYAPSWGQYPRIARA